MTTSETQTPAESTTTAVEGKETVNTAESTTTAVDTKTDPQASPAAEANETHGADKSKDPAKPVVPEKYELKTIKDSPLQPADLAKIEADAKAQGLSNEDAQKLVEAKEAHFVEYHGRMTEAAKAQQTAWVDEIKTDKEIGGKAFKENIEIAHRGLNRFADDAFKKVLSESGLGNNPHLIRTFYRIGKQMENDKAVLDGTSGAPDKKASRESKLYPTMNQK